jgi:hypothetical protein
MERDIDPKVLHAAVARRFHERFNVHADETRVARDEVRQALVEADRAMAFANSDAERLDISKRTVMLAQRYRLLGGEIGDVPGHEGKVWK